MNKFKFFLLAAALTLVSSVTMAQKTGYIRVDDVVRLMPETSKLDSLIQRYQTDSLAPQYEYTYKEYMRKDSIVNGKDSLKTPATVRNKMRQELLAHAQELQNWQQYAGQMVQAKQDQLLEPIYSRAVKAVQDVAKENGYTWVYTKDAILVGPPADDLLPLVAKKLNLKLPAGVTPGIR